MSGAKHHSYTLAKRASALNFFFMLGCFYRMVATILGGQRSAPTLGPYLGPNDFCIDSGSFKGVEYDGSREKIIL